MRILLIFLLMTPAYAADRDKVVKTGRCYECKQGSGNGGNAGRSSPLGAGGNSGHAAGGKAK